MNFSHTLLWNHGRPDEPEDPFLVPDEARADPASPFKVEESPELLELPDFDPEEPSSELTAVFTPEPELPELPDFDPEDPRREPTADLTRELVEVLPELPVFDPEDPRAELRADFTLELVEVLPLPLDDDLDPRAEDTADLILEAVLLTLLETELLRLELELLLELLLLELLLLLLLVLRWPSIPATRRRNRKMKGSLMANNQKESAVVAADES